MGSFDRQSNRLSSPVKIGVGYVTNFMICVTNFIESAMSVSVRCRIFSSRNMVFSRPIFAKKRREICPRNGLIRQAIEWPFKPSKNWNGVYHQFHGTHSFVSKNSFIGLVSNWSFLAHFSLLRENRASAEKVTLEGHLGTDDLYSLVF